MEREKHGQAAQSPVSHINISGPYKEHRETLSKRFKLCGGIVDGKRDQIFYLNKLLLIALWRTVEGNQEWKEKQVTL